MQLFEQEMASSEQIVNYLFKEGIQSMFIEGGYQVLDHFISTGLWDEARIFYGKDLFYDGIPAPSVKGEVISCEEYSRSTLKVLVNEVD